MTARGPGVRRRPRAWLTAVLRHAALIAVAALLMLPFYWMLVSALKSRGQIFARPLQWWPDPPVWSNLVAVLDYPGFPYWLLLGNTLFYAGMVTLGTVLSCAAAGYSFACLRWRGRDTLFAATVATLLIPAIATFLPTYLIWARLGLTGTYWPLILPAYLGNAFFIFMLRQFFLGIPRELFDAARMDGAGELRIFLQIALPIVRPALIVVAVFTTLYTWHDFFGPLIYLQDPADFPLSVGLFAFRSQRTTEWALSMTAALYTTLPLVLLFALASGYFLRGARIAKF
jgi:multiple sugar transport system permease protein